MRCFCNIRIFSMTNRSITTRYLNFNWNRSDNFNPYKLSFNRGVIEEVLRRADDHKIKPLNNHDLEKLKQYTEIVDMKISDQLEKNNQHQCSICMETIEMDQKIINLPKCTHHYHEDCLKEWLKYNGNCPICRNSVQKQLFTEFYGNEIKGYMQKVIFLTKIFR